MATDRLKRRIAEALAGPEPRDGLRRIFNDCDADTDASSTTEATTSLHALLDNVKDPILTVDRQRPCADRKPGRGAGVRGRADRNARPRHRGVHSRARCPPRPTLEALADRVDDTFVEVLPELLEAKRCDGRPFTAEVTVSQSSARRRAVFRAWAYAMSPRGGRTSRRCARAKRATARSSRTRPKRSSCSTSIRTVSSTRTRTRRGSSSCRAKLCCKSARGDQPRSISPTACRRSACSAAISTARSKAGAPCSSGCTAIPMVTRFPARCGSFCCRRPSTG